MTYASKAVVFPLFWMLAVGPRVECAVVAVVVHKIFLLQVEREASVDWSLMLPPGRGCCVVVQIGMSEEGVPIPVVVGVKHDGHLDAGHRSTASPNRVFIGIPVNSGS